jgi:hypothetical protein
MHYWCCWCRTSGVELQNLDRFTGSVGCGCLAWQFWRTVVAQHCLLGWWLTVILDYPCGGLWVLLPYLRGRFIGALHRLLLRVYP